jgi:hypothetical protein
MAHDGTYQATQYPNHLTEPQPGASDQFQAQLAEHFAQTREANGGNVDVVAVAHDGLEAAQMAAQFNCPTSSCSMKRCRG